MSYQVEGGKRKEEKKEMVISRGRKIPFQLERAETVSASLCQGSLRELSPTEKDLMDYFFNPFKDDTSIVLNAWERSPSITVSERLRELALNSPRKS